MVYTSCIDSSDYIGQTTFVVGRAASGKTIIIDKIRKAIVKNYKIDFCISISPFNKFDGCIQCSLNKLPEIIEGSKTWKILIIIDDLQKIDLQKINLIKNPNITYLISLQYATDVNQKYDNIIFTDYLTCKAFANRAHSKARFLFQLYDSWIKIIFDMKDDLHKKILYRNMKLKPIY